jgi:hypothetical protein
MRTLDDLGPSKLQSAEQHRIRVAADNLIFSTDLAGDTAAYEALRDIDELCAALVDSGRWQSETAERLEHDVHACGPAEPLAAAP